MSIDYHGAEIQKILNQMPSDDTGEASVEKLNRVLRKHPEIDETYSSWILRLANAEKNEAYCKLCNQVK